MLQWDVWYVITACKPGGYPRKVALWCVKSEMWCWTTIWVKYVIIWVMKIMLMLRAVKQQAHSYTVRMNPGTNNISKHSLIILSHYTLKLWTVFDGSTRMRGHTMSVNSSHSADFKCSNATPKNSLWVKENNEDNNDENNQFYPFILLFV